MNEKSEQRMSELDTSMNLDDSKETIESENSFEPNNLIESGTNDVNVPEATIIEFSSALMAEKVFTSYTDNES